MWKWRSRQYPVPRSWLWGYWQTETSAETVRLEPIDAWVDEARSCQQAWPHYLPSAALHSSGKTHASYRPPGTWRAESHVTLLRIPGVLLKTFLDTTGLRQRFGDMVERIDFVRHSWLFGEQLTPDTLNHIALAMKPVHCPAKDIIDTREVRGLFLVAEGSVVLENRQGTPVETLHTGGFFGEQNVLESGMESLIGRAVSDTVLLRISEFPLVDIPIVHWKLLETATRRSY